MLCLATMTDNVRFKLKHQKAKAQYLLPLKVSIYGVLALQSSIIKITSFRIAVLMLGHRL